MQASLHHYWTNILLKYFIDGKIEQGNSEVSKGNGKYDLSSHFTLIYKDIENEFGAYVITQFYDFHEVHTKRYILVKFDRKIFVLIFF